MDGKGVLYLLITGGLFAIFALIVLRTLRSKNRERLEEAKHRMLADD